MLNWCFGGVMTPPYIRLSNRATNYQFEIQTNKNRSIGFDAPVDIYQLIFGEEPLLAILDDGLAGDDADEGILIGHHGDEILLGCLVDELVHGGGDLDR